MLQQSRSVLLRYGMAALTNALALSATLLLWPLIQPRSSPLFIAAIMVSAWYGGLGPGLLATLLATLSLEYFFMPPIHMLSLSWSHIMQTTVFVLVALLISWLNAARKQADDALREINQNLQAIIKASPLPIFVLDTDLNVKIWNPAAMYAFGWSEQEVRGRSLPIIPEDMREEVQALRERVLRGERFTGVESRRQRKDGSLVDVNLSTAPLYDADGNLNGIMVVIAHIAEHQTGVERLMRSPALELVK